RFGARNLFAAAVAVFTLASLLCGLAPSFSALIAARLLQGAAAAFMSPVGRLVVLRETPKHHIINAIGLIVWPGLIAPVIGPPRATRGAFARPCSISRPLPFLRLRSARSPPGSRRGSPST